MRLMKLKITVELGRVFIIGSIAFNMYSVIILLSPVHNLLLNSLRILALKFVCFLMQGLFIEILSFCSFISAFSAAISSTGRLRF